MWGLSAGRPALILTFAPTGAMLDASLMPGMAFTGELVFYPSAYPLRAIIRTRQPAQALPKDLPGCPDLVEATAGYAGALSANPWLERFPLLLNNVTPIQEAGEWWIYDAQNRRVPLSKGFAYGWTLLAISGGYPIGLFAIWNGERIFPLSAWADGQFISFRAQSQVE